jgi:hypothetical protein
VTNARSARRASARLAGNQRGPSRPIGPDHALVGELVQVGADRRVDAVLPRPARAGQVEPALVLRRGLAVVGVVAVPPAGRVGPVEQHPEAVPLLPVELRHPEPVPALCPAGELRHRAHETRAFGHAADQPVGLQPLEERGRRVRGGLVGHHRAPVPAESFPVGLGADQGRALAELGGQVPHPGECGVQLLPVAPVPRQGPARLDQQHRQAPHTAGAVEVRTELVAEEPQRDRLGHHGLLPMCDPADPLRPVSAA